MQLKSSWNHPVGPLFVFGFTFMIWQNFVETLRALGVTLDLKRAVVLHGGGWKNFKTYRWIVVLLRQNWKLSLVSLKL